MVTAGGKVDTHTHETHLRILRFSLLAPRTDFQMASAVIWSMLRFSNGICLEFRNGGLKFQNMLPEQFVDNKCLVPIPD